MTGLSLFFISQRVLVWTGILLLEIENGSCAEAVNTIYLCSIHSPFFLMYCLISVAQRQTRCLNRSVSSQNSTKGFDSSRSIWPKMTSLWPSTAISRKSIRDPSSTLAAFTQSQISLQEKSIFSLPQGCAGGYLMMIRYTW